MMHRAIERAGANDLMQLAFDVGPVPMQMGAVMLLAPEHPFDPRAAVALIGRRLDRVPRLRQRLVQPPLGGGRRFWLDDARFDVTAHVTVSPCPPPGDRAALLELAVSLITTPLTPSRPLWSATIVTGLTHGEVGVVLVLHHVVADGLGGLAVLTQLADRVGTTDEAGAARAFPQSRPSYRALVIDACRSRLGRLRTVPATLRLMAPAIAELGTGRRETAPHTSFNRPTGPRREVGVAEAEVAGLLRVARLEGGTVNDVLLTAVTGALGRLLSSRGEEVRRLVVSVPVSARTAATRGATSNHVGVTTVAISLAGAPLPRLRAVIATTRSRDRSRPGTSATLLQPAFRVLGAWGVLKRVMDHQRLVNTFVTNMRGPVTPLRFLDARVTAIIPVSGLSGNVGIACTAMSYAGTMTVTVVVDPDVVPEAQELTRSVQRELDGLVTIGTDVP